MSAAHPISALDVIKLARNYKVFPCRPDKRPYTSNGFKDATQDPDTIRTWWRQHPDALVGVPTGGDGGLVVVDLDTHKHDAVTAEWLDRRRKLLASARVHSTRSGGTHHLFRTTNGARYKSGASVELGGKKRPGVDVRAEGGYIIWWPSTGLKVSGPKKIPELPEELRSELPRHGVARGEAAKRTTPSLAPTLDDPQKWLAKLPQLRAALTHLDPTDRDSWRDIGMILSLESRGAQFAFELWDEWSSGALHDTAIESYTGTEDCRRQWDSYRHESAKPLRLATLFSRALSAGYVAPAPVSFTAPQLSVPFPQILSLAGANLSLNANGLPNNNMDNAGRLFEYVKYPLWYDEFLERIVVSVGSKEVYVEDNHVLDMTRWVQQLPMFRSVKKEIVRDAMVSYAYSHTRNSCRDALLALEHDGESRLEHLMPTGFGTPDNHYYRKVGKNFLLAMVRRVLEPGVFVKSMPVLVGAENLGKSSALEALVTQKYYLVANSSILEKDFLQAFRGKMLVDISELHAFRNSEIARIKSIVSTSVDTYRGSYARYSSDHPRQCVFAGTTNEERWNTSTTGATRFWGVQCGMASVKWITDNREQLFAEAVKRVRAGERHWGDVPEDVARQIAEDSRDTHPWETEVLAYFTNHEHATLTELLRDCVGVEVKHHTHKMGREVRDILRANGYTQKSFRPKLPRKGGGGQILGTPYKAYFKEIPTVYNTKEKAK